MAPIAIVSFNHCPAGHATLKYTRLGVVAGNALARYAARHTYVLRNSTPDLNQRHACWAKIPALLAALQDHPAAIWVDSDALVSNPELRLEDMLPDGDDLVFQQPERLFAPFGPHPTLNRQRQPINTGVFMVRRSQWTLDLLSRAYAHSKPVAPNTAWNGLGDQEAITLELAKRPDPFAGVAWVHGLQTLPQDHCHDALFVHFYGDHGDGKLPAAMCHDVVERLGPQLERFLKEPAKMALLHWCAIQNLSPDGAVRRIGPERFGYDAKVLEQALAEQMGMTTADGRRAQLLDYPDQ